MPSDNHKIVIRVDKAPAGQHAGHFNAPTIDEVAIVVVGENLENRDIVLHRRNDQLQRMSETHRSYDALQYPILFWQGEDGCHFSIKMIYPVTGAETNKKVSSMNYYSYRLMVRQNEDNHIFVGVYFTNMLWIYLFITFTCNPKWTEIQQELFTRQSPIDRHDITARVFKMKLKSLMDFIVKHRVFGETRCWMYSVEWQKRGLPHAHILIWLVERIRPNEIDNVISAEIPDNNEDPLLHKVITKNMIHGPCGILNPISPCMVEGKCSKRYPKQLVAETITGNDGYPLYRRRSIDDNGKSTIVKVNRQDIEVDNRWVVPFSPLLCNAYKAHINVEFCHSVKPHKRRKHSYYDAGAYKPYTTASSIKL
ncbi:hypothetical protein evm_014285 [Chilo suppressalis]|nr:hypothetical protein evm_014285 [Chilo suppressalis]